MTWTTIRHDLWNDTANDIAARLRRGEQVVIHGRTGLGKTSLSLAVARKLGQAAVVVRVPSSLDQIERVILEIAERTGQQCLLEVDRCLQNASGRPDAALEVLDRALRESNRLLVVDDIDTLGAFDSEARSVFEERFRALKKWLERHAALRTRETHHRRAQDHEAPTPIRLEAKPNPPCALRNGVDQNLQPLWEVAQGDLHLFSLALSRTLLTEDKESLEPERLDPDEVLADIWSVLPEDMRQVLLYVAIHQRPIARRTLLRALPDIAPATLGEATRALLLESEGEQLWCAPFWSSWCAKKLPEEVAEAHRRLADTFSAGLRLDDPKAGLRAMDILDAYKHFAAIPDLRRARLHARYGVTVLLESARELSYHHEYKKAAEFYDDVLLIDRELRGERRLFEGIGKKPRAYALHYLHYNQQKADPSYPADKAEEGFTASLKEWPENALFWSRLILTCFYENLHVRAMRTLDDALRAIPPEAERQLRVRTVERLVKRKMLEGAVAVWADFHATAPKDQNIERRLLSALAQGWETHLLWARGQTDLYFHSLVRVAIMSTGREYTCELRDPPTAARGPTPKAALSTLIAKLRAEVADLNSRFTHTLSRAQIDRKGALLASIDMVASKLLVGVSDHAWQLGWLERRDGELVFVGAEDEIYALDDRLGDLAEDPRLRFARLRTGKAGEPVGPVEELEEPVEGDPEQIWKEFQRRVSGHDG